MPRWFVEESYWWRRCPELHNYWCKYLDKTVRYIGCTCARLWWRRWRWRRQDRTCKRVAWRRYWRRRRCPRGEDAYCIRHRNVNRNGDSRICRYVRFGEQYWWG